MTNLAPDPRRRALGKGLDSLLPRVPTATVPATSESEGGKPLEIPLDQIDPNPYQTRSNVDQGQLAELAASITANGVVQPILVRPQASGRFQLIAGERRWRASQLAGKENIPAILRQVSDEMCIRDSCSTWNKLDSSLFGTEPFLHRIRNSRPNHREMPLKLTQNPRDFSTDQPFSPPIRIWLPPPRNRLPHNCFLSIRHFHSRPISTALSRSPQSSALPPFSASH